MSSGCRYERAIKQSLNKVFDNKSSVHMIIAELIASYSHKSVVRPGSYLLCPTYHFFVVSDVLSQHWVKGFFCPPRIDFTRTIFGGTRHYYEPDINQRTAIQKKRVFFPFTEPCVRIRQRKFHLESKLRYEQMSHSPPLFT